ncbi:hypothetical protein WL40_15030 [Burkholderia ubonensis]|uniref:Uncharacterized protein n=1 Tax=Burkholderia ubonensis TaxID=101571 RepID=A0A837UYW1_9BURK|nr:hypothetical protein WJ45_02460 [Burkholderia ubonensis]KVM05470.1 hypothetical protein WJ51_26130 [Burkholderia ubonensis]KVM09613.1 hypothetical protein WJ52_23430 [Burkholderia ubonensis]KVM53200.1 hypothetical protein WJ56_09425 [Burkholderia ubonensis]KVN71124.1 hypothetical protein WJ67_24310 [Burkholderia ubonensis]
MNDRKPELRRPVAGPYRQSRWAAVLESLFGFVAKGTMALAALIAVVLAILSGDGLELVSPPTTKKGWMRLLLVLAAVIALVFAVLYFMEPGSADFAGK